MAAFRRQDGSVRDQLGGLRAKWTTRSPHFQLQIMARANPRDHELRLTLQRCGLLRPKLERLTEKSIVVFLGEGRETGTHEAGALACPRTRHVQVVPAVVPETEKPPENFPNSLTALDIFGWTRLHPMQVRYQAALRPDSAQSIAELLWQTADISSASR